VREDSRLSKKKVSLLAKVGLSGLLIWYLLHRIPLHQIFASLAEVNLYWLMLALCLAGLGKIISTLRWRYLLSVQDISVPFSVLFSSLLVGYFFNNFLPSTIGGDAMRAFDIARYSRRNMASAVTVVTERVMGILALASVALVAACAGYRLIETVGHVFYLVLAFFLLSVGGFYIVTQRVFVNRLVRLAQWAKLAKMGRLVSEAYAAFGLLRDHKGALLNTYLISALLQVNVLLYYYVISLSLHLEVSIAYFFCIIPVVLVILQLPISINGIGVREGLYVFFFGLVGVAGQKAIAFSWLDFGMTILMGIAGGTVFALRRSHRGEQAAAR